MILLRNGRAGTVRVVPVSGRAIDRRDAAPPKGTSATRSTEQFRAFEGAGVGHRVAIGARLCVRHFDCGPTVGAQGEAPDSPRSSRASSMDRC